MHEKRLQRVARGRVVALAVDAQLARHVDVRVRVYVHVTHAIRVPEHGDLRVVLDVRHEVVAPARDDEVDDVVELEDVRDLRAAFDEDDRFFRDAELRKALHDDAMQDRVRLRRLLAALEEEAVPGPDRQRSDLRQRVRARLEDDQEHAERRGDLLEHQPVREFHLRQRAHEGFLHARDLTRPLRELRDLPGLHLQAVHQRRLGAVLRGFLQVELVLAQDGGLVRLERVRDSVQELRALVGRQILELARRRARGDSLLARGGHRAGATCARAARSTRGRCA